MEKLLTFLNSLSPERRLAFCEFIGTTENTVRKDCSIRRPLNSEVVMRIEKFSDRQVTCEDLRPDLDWAFIRAGSV